MISAKKLLFKACEKIGAIKNEVTGLATTVASHTSTLGSLVYSADIQKRVEKKLQS